MDAKEEIENFAVYLNSKGLFYKKVENFKDINLIAKAGDEYANKKIVDISNKIQLKIDFVIEMWKDPKNEMDFLHTLETLKSEIISVFDKIN